ncbi:DsrE/DsrF-like family protein [bacterium BMS3Abin07]|nr:DsrE/DsrF-like family protein [bacterium BMS3Abin07]HDO23542.1 hypothetical protein [Nitrospirota bacterium]HDZ87489.1 hypothetical protein [Nitrospirota bacterium]
MLKVVFHMDMDNTPTFELAVGNIANLQKDVGPENARVSLLANGNAVKHFVKEANIKYLSLLEELHTKGVKFYLCNNSLNKHGLKKEQMFDFCEVVPAGVTKLVELQKEGYAYIKP